MTEQVLLFGTNRCLVGMLTEPEKSQVPADLPAFILFNAGLLHRVGPNRLHVTLARRLARRGFPVLRFDFSGIGDSRVAQRFNSVRRAPRWPKPARRWTSLLAQCISDVSFPSVFVPAPKWHSRSPCKMIAS